MKRIDIALGDAEIAELRGIVSKGKRTVREVTREQILLLANEGRHNDEISGALHVDRDTVTLVKKRYIAGGMDSAIHDRPRSGQPKKYDTTTEAIIVAMACSSPPKGRKRWTVRLIAEEMGRRGSDINRESVRIILKKQHETLEKKNVVHPGH